MMNDTEYDWGVASVSVAVMVTRNRPSEVCVGVQMITLRNVLAVPPRRAGTTDQPGTGDTDAR
jgi:hypothetical protein